MFVISDNFIEFIKPLYFVTMTQRSREACGRHCLWATFMSLSFTFFLDFLVLSETCVSCLKSTNRGLKGQSEVKMLEMKTAHYMKKSSLYFRNGNLNECDSYNRRSLARGHYLDG